MSYLGYWSFPLAFDKAAVLVSTDSHTEISVIDLVALPHFLTQLERASTFIAEPVTSKDEAHPTTRAPRVTRRTKTSK